MGLKQIIRKTPLFAALALGTTCIHPNLSLTPKDTIPVVFSPYVRNAFEFGYDNITDKLNLEYGWCLHGNQSKKGDTIYVNSAEHPFIYETDPHGMIFECRDTPTYLGKAHTHNIKYWYNNPCRQSPLDKENFILNGEKIDVVVCDKDRSVLVR